MTWIKKPIFPLQKSGTYNTNFLYRSGKVYIMDNHLCAGWAWLNELNTSKKYNLLHIDRHYDLIGMPHTIEEEIIKKGINLHELSFNEFLDLKQPMRGGDVAPMFRFDNYILNLSYVYPHFFGKKYFATHEDGTLPEGFVDNEIPFYTLIGSLVFLNQEYSENDWIINIDLDYFFNDVDGKFMQCFTNMFIESLTIELKKVLDNIAVITISLSPEFCGGWENALGVTNKICSIMEIDFNINSYARLN